MQDSFGVQGTGMNKFAQFFVETGKNYFNLEAGVTSVRGVHKSKIAVGPVQAIDGERLSFCSFPFTDKSDKNAWFKSMHCVTTNNNGKPWCCLNDNDNCKKWGDCKV